MRVKKFQAVDMPDALRRIKEELGPEAVILSTRQIKPGKGVFGMLGRPILEVTAAAGLETLAAQGRSGPGPSPGGKAARGSSRPGPGEAAGRADHGPLLALQADLDSLREELAVLGRRPSPPGEEALARDVGRLSEKLDRLLEQTARFDRLRLAPGLRRLHAHLEAVDLDRALAARIVAFLQEKMDAGGLAEGREVEGFQELVRRTVRVAGGLHPPARGPRVIALVGPTGVGKTTTVAKLSARFALQDGARVGLLTVDTFRIAAVEQLKTYAKIMGVPLRVALDAEGFRAAVAELADREIILVDTAGQSPRDEEALAELLGLFPQQVPVEVHLVLSVTTRASDLERILRHYAGLRATRLLLTKLDETDCHGPLLGLPAVSRLPLSYLTTGQNVPDDIEEATPEAVARYVCGALGAEESG
ncbi:MAG: flagellar biosynthesis protein FlhF [Deferrisomatales bacterium]|nr:flagellar biosynthesis protein FlhF [Deferrisomatales bacterium]